MKAVSTRWRLLAFLGMVGIVPPSVGAQGCEPKAPDDVLRCALKYHPDIQRQQAAQKRGDVLEASAAQRPNPEFATKIGYGKLQGETVLNTEFSLSHTFELGGKRAARIERASAQRAGIAAGFLQAKEVVFISTAKALYRLRQAQNELHVVQEALANFSRIQKLFKSRPRLGPEQQVSLEVFRLAEGDQELRKTKLSTEIGALLKDLESAIGTSFAPLPELLPPKKAVWPEIADASDESRGSGIKLADAEIQAARAELAEAESQAWPDLKVGPSFETQKQGATSFQTYGFVLSVPLPLYHANGAGKEGAGLGVQRAEQNKQLRRRELGLQRRQLVHQYTGAVKALKETASFHETERKHRNIEELFQRGLVTATLVIEAHRQIFDFTRSQNESELEAIEALSVIRALDGTLFEEKI